MNNIKIIQHQQRKKQEDKRTNVFSTLVFALFIVLTLPFGPSFRDFCEANFRKWVNINMYKVEINRKGKKKYTILTTTDANLNQNKLGHAEYCMHTPPEAIFVVGKNRA